MALDFAHPAHPIATPLTYVFDVIHKRAAAMRPVITGTVAAGL